MLWCQWGRSLFFPVFSLFFNICRSATQIVHACFGQSACYCTGIGNTSCFRQRWSSWSAGLWVQTQAIITAIEVSYGVIQSEKLLIDNQLTTVKEAAASSVPMHYHRISWDFCLVSVWYVSQVHMWSSMLYALNSSHLVIPNSDDIWRKKLREWKVNVYMQNSSRKVQLLWSSFPFSSWRG